MVPKPKKQISGHEQVMEFLQQLDHPMKTEIEEVRKIILGTSDRITERIKWNAPSFCVDNEDRITFNLHGKAGFRLIFHCGTKATEHAKKGPLFEDDTQLLEWITGDRAMMSFSSTKDVENYRDQLIKIVKNWIEATSHL